MNPSKVPFNIAGARIQRWGIVPIRREHGMAETITLWKRPTGAPINGRGGLVRATFKLPEFDEPEKPSRQVRRSLKRELTRGPPEWYRPNRHKPGLTRRYKLPEPV